MIPVKVVAIGGGFTAVKFAKTLRGKLLGSECEIFLFNRENHMVFHPLLADVAGASINVAAAAAPLRQMLPGVNCHTGRVHRIDLPSSEIAIERYVVCALSRMLATGQLHQGDVLLIDRHRGDEGLVFLRDTQKRSCDPKIGFSLPDSGQQMSAEARV